MFPAFTLCLVCVDEWAEIRPVPTERRQHFRERQVKDIRGMVEKPVGYQMTSSGDGVHPGPEASLLVNPVVVIFRQGGTAARHLQLRIESLYQVGVVAGDILACLGIEFAAATFPCGALGDEVDARLGGVCLDQRDDGRWLLAPAHD